MSAWEIVSQSPAETRAVGVRLGRLARSGDLYLLSGELGSGKTTLTQGIAAGLGAGGRVTSPTFTLINEYRGRLMLAHVDLYRLPNAESIETIGLEDYLEGNGVTIVEWPERAADWLPEDSLAIRLRDLGGDARQIAFEPTGHRYVELLEQLRRDVEAA